VPVSRQQPPRLKGLKWHDAQPQTKAEKILMWIGTAVAAFGLAVLIWSFF